MMMIAIATGESCFANKIKKEQEDLNIMIKDWIYGNEIGPIDPGKN